MTVQFVHVKDVSPERIALWESWLTPEKRQRLDQLPPKKRLQSLCGDGLVREMLAERLEIAPEAVAFSYNENGKPLTKGAYFSISHSEDAVVCAVGDVALGVDMEKIRAVPPHLGRALAGKWTTQEDFWRGWTSCEAIVKCRGEKLWSWKTVKEEYGRLTYPEFPGYAVAICEEK